MEVFILGHKNELMVASHLPYGTIGSTEEPQIREMRRSGKHVIEQPNQPRREILVEEEFRQDWKGGKVGSTRQQTLAFRGECEAGADIIPRQRRELLYEIVLSHATREVAQHVADSDPCTSHGRLAKADLRIQHDALAVV
jgi:hypothetical protein